jgi:hypothetical protein
MSNLPKTQSKFDAEIKTRTSEYFTRIKTNSLELLQPHLVAIYHQTTEPKVKTQQVGTGFLVRHKGRPVLVTAKHTLYGRKGNENPGEKAIVVAGVLTMIGNLRSHEVVQDKIHDIAAIYVDEFDLERCLPPSSLPSVDSAPKFVTIHGFLARDFNLDRPEDTLKPAPWVYTNSRTNHGSGYIALLYPKHRNRNTDSGLKVMAPIPQGLSGCPMLDGEKLSEREVSIIGVFTDFPDGQGIAFGESSAKVIALLDGM